MGLPAKVFHLKLIKKEEVAVDVYAFYFSSQDKFDFIPGQYLQMTLPHEKADDRGTSRFFSITSSPTEKYLIVTTKKGKSSFKQKLFALKTGARIMAFGPIGKFVLEEMLTD